jgi:hypothetical protein
VEVPAAPGGGGGHARVGVAAAVVGEAVALGSVEAAVTEWRRRPRQGGWRPPCRSRGGGRVGVEVASSQGWGSHSQEVGPTVWRRRRTSWRLERVSGGRLRPSSSVMRAFLWSSDGQIHGTHGWICRPYTRICVSLWWSRDHGGEERGRRRRRKERETAVGGSVEGGGWVLGLVNIYKHHDKYRPSDREIDGSHRPRCSWAGVKMGRGVCGLKCLRVELHLSCGLLDAQQTPILCRAPGSLGARQRFFVVHQVYTTHDKALFHLYPFQPRN